MENATPKTEATKEPEATKDIQEILRQRREMLTRVRADLDKVKKLQQDFSVDEGKRAATPSAKK